MDHLSLVHVEEEIHSRASAHDLDIVVGRLPLVEELTELRWANRTGRRQGERHQSHQGDSIQPGDESANPVPRRGFGHARSASPFQNQADEGRQQHDDRESKKRSPGPHRRNQNQRREVGADQAANRRKGVQRSGRPPGSPHIFNAEPHSPG